MTGVVAMLAPSVIAFMCGTLIHNRLELRDIKEDLHGIRQKLDMLCESGKQGDNPDPKPTNG